ncbi:MAG: ABC transporter ATP-binding protein [Proteobacteria bacterium]|nr:ABC transporter ATP-binding protein [Pseudomonadota bacterium]
MIEIRGLTYSYPEADNPALENISLDIREGELVLLIGPTGSGKSTFLYCLNGLIPHIFAGDIRGEIRVNGFSPKETSVADMAKNVGTVFQNPESQIFMLRIEDDVAFGCENLMMPREDVIARRDTAMMDMGLVDVRHESTQTLSGGMKQRLAISSIYAMGPKVFLFDEPTADLDVKGRSEFIEIVSKLKRRGHTILVAEHRYEDLLPFANKIIAFDKGQIFRGVKAVNPFNQEMKQKTCDMDTTLEVELKDVTFSYDKKGGRKVLEGINIAVKKGELVAVCGDNGSGKTTLLKIMAGVLRSDNGSVRVSGCDNPRIEDVVGKVGFLFQNPDEQLFNDSVEEELMFGPRQLEKNIDVEQYLGKTNLAEARKRHPQSLSRGQRQLLAVFSVLAMEPQVVLLDEPTTGLDDESWHNLFGILRELSNSGKTVLFTTHHEKAKKYADRLITIDRGRVAGSEISR